jgi:hypothetical protein
VDRSNRKLIANGLWLEEWFTADAAFAQALARGFSSLAHLLRVETMDTEAITLAALRAEVGRLLRSAGL